MRELETDIPSSWPTIRRRRSARTIDFTPLLDQDGAAGRDALIKWCMNVWRLLALLEIPVLIFFSPEIFSSTSRAWLVFGGVLAYSLLFFWLSLNFDDFDRLHIRTVDQLVCAALILVFHEGILIYILSFYAYTSITTGPHPKLREVLLPAAGLSLALIVAISIEPEPFYDLSTAVIECSFFFIWALSFFAFSRILDAASSLELDNRMEEQRQGFRRYLHDDLGNTLCGLHFKIQSMKRGNVELRDGLDFLADGYNRAADALANLLSGIETIADRQFTDSLDSIARRSHASFGLIVRVGQSVTKPHISPEVRSEVLAIVNEAVANSAKHANAREVRINVRRKRGFLNISISDDGDGFGSAQLVDRQTEGGMGIRGMRERAALIDAELVVDGMGQEGPGTTVTLRLPEQKGTGSLRRFANDIIISRVSAYPVLATLKLLVSTGLLLQVPLMEPELQRQPLVWLLAGAIFLDGFLTFLLRSKLLVVLKRSPWLLFAEQLFFSVLLFLAWRADLPFFFDAAPSIGLVFSAYFLGIARNMKLAAVLSAGMILANLLAPSATTMRATRMQELIINIIENAIIALCAGMAVELLERLGALKQEALSRVLGRQREQMTTKTHERLHGQVEKLAAEIESLRAKGDAGHGYGRVVSLIEAQSSDLKKGLRQILRSLDRPGDDSADMQRVAGRASL